MSDAYELANTWIVDKLISIEEDARNQKNRVEDIAPFVEEAAKAYLAFKDKLKFDERTPVYISQFYPGRVMLRVVVPGPKACKGLLRWFAERGFKIDGEMQEEARNNIVGWRLKRDDDDNSHIRIRAQLPENEEQEIGEACYFEKVGTRIVPAREEPVYELVCPEEN